MDQSNKKILTVSFIVAGALAAYVYKVLLTVLTPLFSGMMARVLASDVVNHVIPVLLGFGVFLALQLNKNVLAWGDEVVTEIKKVVWPSRKDTVAMTIVVCIMVMISAIFISLFDFASSQLINLIVTL